MNELDKIKAKIKKLLALSKSPNANEAAVALEMAQKLMMEYGVQSNEAGDFEITEKDVKGNGGRKPLYHETRLISKIAVAFGCKSAYGFLRRETGLSSTIVFGHTFVGLDHRVQICSFIAEVLLRKMKKARSEYIKTLRNVRLRQNKIKRADEFCRGWVSIVSDKLKHFANSKEENAAIDLYAAGLGWKDGLKTLKRSSVKSGANDFLNGYKAGSGVQIQHGVTGSGEGSLLLEGNK